MAAELKLVHPSKAVRLVHSRGRLLSSEPLPDEVKDKTLELMRDAGVDVLLNSRVTEVKEVREGGEEGEEVYKVKIGRAHV